MPYPQSVEELINRTSADSVYMLLHPGWSTEARANRWHMGTRWARHLPVTFVVPEKGLLDRAVAVERRIPNCRVLRVPANHGPLWGMAAQLQAGSVLSDMRGTGARYPILWLYNATMLEAFAAAPAVARVHHITENYFDFEGIDASYLERVRLAARLADLNVAISEGCARPLLGDAAGRMVVAANGCDYAVYGADVAPDARIASYRRTFHRIAVYGGNINARLDFDLIGRLADAAPDTLLAFVGPVRLPSDLVARFRALQSLPNVRYFGAVDPDDLPAIYRAADLGFMPYTIVPLHTENGFPLKVLEMCATGLPVVSIPIRALKPLSPPLHVTNTSEEFIAAFLAARREPALAAELRALASRNDYDERFGDITARIAESDPRAGTRLGALPAPIAGTEETVVDVLVRQRWSWSMVYWRLRIQVLGRLATLVDRLPDPMRDLVVRVKRAFIAPSKLAG